MGIQALRARQSVQSHRPVCPGRLTHADGVYLLQQLLSGNAYLNVRPENPPRQSIHQSSRRGKLTLCIRPVAALRRCTRSSTRLASCRRCPSCTRRLRRCDFEPWGSCAAREFMVTVPPSPAALLLGLFPCAPASREIHGQRGGPSSKDASRGAKDGRHTQSNHQDGQGSFRGPPAADAGLRRDLGLGESSSVGPTTREKADACTIARTRRCGASRAPERRPMRADDGGVGRPCQEATGGAELPWNQRALHETRKCCAVLMFLHAPHARGCMP